MKKYGLIGYPLGHSFSRNFFNEKFESEKVDAEYLNFEIPKIDEFPQVVSANPTLNGLNVTIPYKEQVMHFLNEVSPEAKEIGAVNVIKFDRSKGKLRLVGYNSDVIGFTLKKLGLETRFVSRGKKDDETFTYSQLTPEVMEEYKVIVNCSPVGMYPHTDECPDIPYECLTPRHLLYDLVYNPNTTLFMKKGSEKGAVTKNGLEMLLLQAFAAWEIWNK